MIVLHLVSQHRPLAVRCPAYYQVHIAPACRTAEPRMTLPTHHSPRPGVDLALRTAAMVENHGEAALTAAASICTRSEV